VEATAGKETKRKKVKELLRYVNVAFILIFVHGLEQQI
jgi:hypothetical protein